MSGPGRGPGPRGPMAGGAPGQKAQNFGPSAKRLLGTLRVDSARLVTVLVLGVVSVTLSVRRAAAATWRYRRA